MQQQYSYNRQYGTQNKNSYDKRRKIEMYNKLSKKDLIELLMDNQDFLNNIVGMINQNTWTTTSNPPGTWEPNNPWFGIVDPRTGDFITPTYTTMSNVGNS